MEFRRKNTLVTFWIIFIYRAESKTGQKQGNHTIHTVLFITVRAVMTLLTYCNEENRTNRVVSLLLARNSFDPF